ncbi:MAG TPA: ATP-binding cassette domain-containing protein, partial [Solirubrobacterales bacterium]|nr:ATP-binding cassette domain-containing protein [Solirubrobacterales bacterium]
SALDNAALALRNRGLGRAAARAQAGELFDRFGLGGFEGARPQELSGGMRQRVAFLRTLVAGKPVLLLDEPFASLDAISRAEMQEWLAGALLADGRTVLLVSHDLEEALYLADRVLVLSARPGRVVKELRAPDPRASDRDGAVTDPAFVAAREAALRALHAGAGRGGPERVGLPDEEAR